MSSNNRTTTPLLPHSEIVSQVLKGIEFIGARDVCTSINPPKCVGVLPSQKGLLALQTCGATHQ